MKISVISIVKNEIDIIETWIKHAIKMFDFIYIADHMSSDGTYELLLKYSLLYKKICLFKYTERDFDQQNVFQKLRELIINNTDADWVCVLDADEFLQYKNKQDFIDELNSAYFDKIIFYRWCNCYPKDPGKVKQQFKGFKQTNLSKYGKIFINRDIATNNNYLIPKGAHHLVHKEIGKIKGIEYGELYHIPYRSLTQSLDKILNGTINRLRILHQDRHNTSSRHYPHQVNMLINHPSWDIAPILTYNYGEQDAVKQNIYIQKQYIKDKKEFEDHIFNISGIHDELIDSDSYFNEIDYNEQSLTEIMQRPYFKKMTEEIMSLNKVSDSNSLCPSLTILNDNELTNISNYATKTFSELDDISNDSLKYNDIFSALQASFWEIKYPAQSAWGEHIPFLFSIISLLKPRRFVELGVHNGASFFAACQAIRRLELNTTCIAIDNWKGDTHAGVYNDAVFKKFRKHLKENYVDFAGYIRADFDDAIANFYDGSIDLLHIDGLHTVNAVNHDFHTWISKISDRGIILFHDINEFKSDFGVWRFWRKIRSEYPHIEFGHGHGLGLLIIGRNNPLHSQTDKWSQSLITQEANDIFQVLYGGIGKLSWQLAQYSNKESNNKNIPKMQSYNDETQRIINKYENSLSWKITKPLRVLKRILKNSIQALRK